MSAKEGRRLIGLSGFVMFIGGLLALFAAGNLGGFNGFVAMAGLLVFASGCIINGAIMVFFMTGDRR